MTAGHSGSPEEAWHQEGLVETAGPSWGLRMKSGLMSKKDLGEQGWAQSCDTCVGKQVRKIGSGMQGTDNDPASGL